MTGIRKMPTAVVDRLWPGFLIVSMAIFAMLSVAGPGWLPISVAVVGFGSVAAVVVGLLLHDPRPRAPWLLLAAGQFLFVSGDIVAAIIGGSGTATAAEWLATLLYLSGYPIVTLGFALLVVRRPLGAGWAVVLDGGILTAGLALVAWIAFADPILSDAGLRSVDRAIDIAYLLCDIALIAVVACLLLGSETGTPSFRLFVLAVFAMVVGDGLAGLDSHWTGSWEVQLTYFAGYGLWGAAALHRSMSKPARLNIDKARRMTGIRISTVIGACLVAPALLAYQGLTNQKPDWATLSLGAAVIVVLAITSMVDMVREQALAAEKQLVLEERFRQTSETLRAILDSSPLPIIVVDRHRRVLFWSRAAEQLFGYTEKETLGQRSPFVPPDQSAEGRALMPRVLAGASIIEQELPGRTKDGRPINVRAHFAPIADDTGRILGAISLMEDTSELDRLQAELFEARKLESVGRLAGGIAHDFNNILTAILGFADLSLEEPPGTDLTEYSTGIRDAAERAAGLTQQLLAFSRRQMLQPQILEVNAVVAGIESMLRRLIGEQIELRIDLDPEAGCLRADRTQLEQVILNLTLNARDAMPEGGRLVVHTGHQRYTHASRSRPRELEAGDYVSITVTDTGMGMVAETRDHIFEPFFTTKGRGRGTGLGLATTYGIIKQSGGSILVNSEPGHGTTFRIFFPTVMREAPSAKPIRQPETGGRSGGRSGRILLVEDEPGLRDIAQRVLARSGFDVLTAAGPDEAILEADSSTEPFDLLLTDVVMPSMRGPELAIRLRNKQPGLKVLLVSGYAEEIVEGERDDSLPFLAKPFTAESLLAAVETAMRPADEQDGDGPTPDALVQPGPESVPVSG